jgi:DNA ligase-1
MLAETCEDINGLKYPVLASPKLDGIRCVKPDAVALSRKFIAIPNIHIQSAISSIQHKGLDGEIMVNGATFNQIQSQVMSEHGKPDFTYVVFDYVTDIKTPYETRMQALAALELPSFCSKLLPQIIGTPEELLAYETQCLNQGYEGVMVRAPSSPYKCGRSTVRESYLLKIKRFTDSEAVILDFEERLHNANEAVKDELGHTKRSSHKANLVPMDTLGAFLVQDITTGLQFKVATGMDDMFRKSVWSDREQYKGKILKYKYQKAGMKDLPRFPVFIGFRDPRDL